MSRKRLLYVLASLLGAIAVSFGVYRYGGRLFASNAGELKPFPVDELKPFPRSQTTELKPFPVEELKPFPLKAPAAQQTRTPTPTANR
jgi:hypothetical protein